MVADPGLCWFIHAGIGVVSPRWPSVGVVIPNHDRVQELSEAIASVEAQHYEGQVQVYVVYRERPGVADALSTREQVVALPYFDEEDRNPIAAKRNVGLSASTEDLVAFLDDDDIWHPLKLVMQVEAIRDGYNVAAVGTRATYFSGQPRWNYLSGGKGYRDCTRHRVVSAPSVGTSSLLVVGATARNLRFDERPEWLGVEDFDFKIRLSQLGPIRELRGRYTAYRADNTSASLEESRHFLLRALSVLAASAERDPARLSQQLSALRLLLASTFGGLGSIQEFHGGEDKEAEQMLEQILTGRLFGRLDHPVRRVVRTGWRRGWAVRPVRRVVRTLKRTVRLLVRLARSGPGRASRSQWIPPCGSPRA